MNSKHVSGISGVSTILKISPMKILVNAKQLQDFLLFREIWMPPEIRQSSSAPVANNKHTTIPELLNPEISGSRSNWSIPMERHRVHC